jgi:hypothetical protein
MRCRPSNACIRWFAGVSAEIGWLAALPRRN